MLVQPLGPVYTFYLMLLCSFMCLLSSFLFVFCDLVYLINLILFFSTKITEMKTINFGFKAIDTSHTHCFQ